MTDRVRVQFPDGSFGTVPQASLDSVLRDGGRAAFADERAPEKPSVKGAIKEHLEGQLAGILGAARGMTMGGSDEQALAAGDVVGQRERVRSFLNESREKHPVMSAVGEVGGAIVPGIETGGMAEAAPLARAAGAIERAAPALERAAPIAEDIYRGGEEATRAIPRDLGGFEKLTPENLAELNRRTPTDEAWVRSADKYKPKKPVVAEELTRRDTVRGLGPERPDATEVISNPEAKALAKHQYEEAFTHPLETPEAYEPTLPGAPPARPAENTLPSAFDATVPESAMARPPTERIPEPGIDDTMASPGQRRPIAKTLASATERGTDLAETMVEPRGKDLYESGAATKGLRGAKYPGKPTIHDGVFEEETRAAAQELVSMRPTEVARAAAAVDEAALAKTSVAKLADMPVSPSAEGAARAVPSGIVAHLGDEIERGIVKAMGGEAKSLLGKMLQEAAAKGARGAFEGGLYGGTQQLDEDQLGGHETNGQRLAASVGWGALLGGATGGALGTGGVLTRRVAGEVGMRVSKLRGSLAFRSLMYGPAKPYINAANRIPGGTAAVGDFLLSRGLIQAGDSIENIAPKVRLALDTEIDRMSALLEAHDVASIRGPALRNIYRNLLQTRQRLLEAPNMNAGALRAMDAAMADVEQAAVGGEVGFRDAQQLRARIDDKVKWITNPLQKETPESFALKGVRRAIEREIEDAVDRGSKLGPVYREAKDSYRKLKVASQVLDNSLAQKASNGIASLTDNMVMLAASATGHPLAGLLEGVAHKVVRERGFSTAAVLLDKMAALQVIRRSNGLIERQMDRGVARIFGDDRAELAIKPRIFDGDHKARVDAIARALMNGDHMAEIQRAAEPIMEHAPKTAGAFMRSATRITQYLSTKLPEEKQEGPSFTPHLDEIAWDDSSRAEFDRAVDVANDPMVVLVDIENGSLVPDQVEAFKAMHPDIYADVCDRIATRLAQQKEPLSYDRQMALSILLDQPAGPTLVPEFVATMQSNFPQEHGLPPPGAKKKGGKRPKKTDLNFSQDLELAGLNESAGEHL